MKSSRLQKALVAFALFAALVVLPLYAWKVALKGDYTDFEVYYRAALRAREGNWARVYNLADGASPFRYAPPVLPILMPLARLALPHARLLWYFLQYLWFGAGFCFLYLGISRLPRGRKLAPFITAFAGLFILRLCLDTFTIGQTSSLLFLGFCLGFYGWMAKRPGWMGIGLFIPAFFKIGPGFLYLLLIRSRHHQARRVIRTSISVLFGLGALLWLTVPRAAFIALWKAWVTIVQNDSVYYDASHYGSQSVKSFLLRLAKQGWITVAQASHAHLITTGAGCLLVLGFWALRRPKSMPGRGLFFALGIFPYLWFMPETFKYSLTPLAIPVAVLLACPKRTRLGTFALVFGALTISLAGLDIVGETVFFWLQKASVPLFATFALGLAVLESAWHESSPVSQDQALSLGPWESLPAPRAELEASLLIPLPLDSAIAIDRKLTGQVLSEAHAFFTARLGESFEILIAPFGDRVSELHPLGRAIREQCAKLPRVRILPPPRVDGRGSALREAFLASRGKILLTTHIEQPCTPEFYERALIHLGSGAQAPHLVRANRRLHASRFRIPVRLLPLVFGRHRLGIAFNRVVRLLLPIETTDTHSGIYAMSRELATVAFALQSAPDFLFDLELALACRAHGFRDQDIPVTLYLAEEKSPTRMMSETLGILFGLPRLAWRYYRGCYSPFATTSAPRITADDWGISPGVNQGVLELARAGVIRRVSILADCRYVENDLEELKRIPGIELGLHFNLTYGEGQHGRPARFLLDWLRPGGRARLAPLVCARFDSQLAKLRALGVHVAYLDGHHHIHVVPGLIDALSNRIAEAQIRQVRLPYDPMLWLTPKFPLNLLSCLARARFRKLGLVSLPCFYPKFAHFLDHGRMRADLARHGASEVIVHPARTNDLETLEYPDPYTEGRVTEYHALRMLSVELTPKC